MKCKQRGTRLFETALPDIFNTEGATPIAAEILLRDVFLDAHVSQALACGECCLPADLCPGHAGGGA